MFIPHYDLHLSLQLISSYKNELIDFPKLPLFFFLQAASSIILY